MTCRICRRGVQSFWGEPGICFCPVAFPCTLCIRYGMLSCYQEVFVSFGVPQAVTLLREPVCVLQLYYATRVRIWSCRQTWPRQRHQWARRRYLRRPRRACRQRSAGCSRACWRPTTSPRARSTPPCACSTGALPADHKPASWISYALTKKCAMLAAAHVAAGAFDAAMRLLNRRAAPQLINLHLGLYTTCQGCAQCWRPLMWLPAHSTPSCALLNRHA